MDFQLLVLLGLPDLKDDFRPHVEQLDYLLIQLIYFFSQR